MKNFLTTANFERADLDELIESAGKFKSGEDHPSRSPGRSVVWSFSIPVCARARQCRLRL